MQRKRETSKCAQDHLKLVNTTTVIGRRNEDDRYATACCASFSLASSRSTCLIRASGVRFPNEA